MAATSVQPVGATTAPSPPDRRALVVPMPPDRLVSWLWAVGVTALAGVLRFTGLGKPDAKEFDEVYYAKDAHDLLRYGYERTTDNSGPSFIAHPPLGKWLIGLGEQAFGYNSFGWRVSAAVVGTLSVLVLVRVARRMTRSTLLGCIAGVLISLDGLHFVQSRVAMLDIFLMWWILVAFACLLIDRDAMRARLAAGAPPGLRPWRLVAAVSLGCALATKWSAIWYVVAFGLLAFAWECGARRSAGIPSPVLLTAQSFAGWGAVYLVAVLAVYTAAWSGWFASTDAYDRAYGANAVVGWIHYHREILRFHTSLTTYHRYASLPWSWLLLARPVAYFYSSPTDCGQQYCSREVLALGNPVLWWPFAGALVAMAWRWLARRDWRGAAVLAGVGASFLPWLPYPHRTMFLFYALPALPFLVLATTMCLGMVLGRPDASPDRRLFGAIGVAAYVVLVAVTFAFFYPVLAGQTLSYVAWHHRMWFPTWI
ncbi:MAG: phospholipid carrier-dependent glycosyltransferase [Actinomycetota bacterium]|nr:phospholipid carrier-dependent glycosyltransferase [Actinomycetota bacterium]